MCISFCITVFMSCSTQSTVDRGRTKASTYCPLITLNYLYMRQGYHSIKGVKSNIDFIIRGCPHSEVSKSLATKTTQSSSLSLSPRIVQSRKKAITQNQKKKLFFEKKNIQKKKSPLRTPSDSINATFSAFYSFPSRVPCCNAPSYAFSASKWRS